MKTSITAAQRDELVKLACKANGLMQQTAAVEDEMCALLDGEDEEHVIDHVCDCVSWNDPTARVAYMLAMLGIEVA